MITLNTLLHAAHLSSNEEDIEIKGLAIDSRKVKPGYLFAALTGDKTDGRLFIPQAIQQGAIAILMPMGRNTFDAHCLCIYTENPRQVLAKMAGCFFGKQPDQLIAITGTNGKTSIADFLRQIWTLQKYPAASIGTLGIISPLDIVTDGPILTTPDSVTLHQTLSQLVQNNINHVAIEASSHGLAQMRLDGLQLQAAGFSNLTRDHLDYHHDFSTYLHAKLRLFQELLPPKGIAAANADMDEEPLSALKSVAQQRELELRLVGIKGNFLRLRSVDALSNGQRITVLTEMGTEHTITIPLLGRYQIDNILLAVALAAKNVQEIPSLLHLLPYLKGVRGRMERAAILPNGATIYVDYAHTPDALMRVLQSARPHCRNQLYILFGAGGDRDHGKRPLMGQCATRYADQVIVTDDNPRTENPSTIRQEIMIATPNATEIAGREEAIAQTLQKLKNGDVLIVAGKGHEQGQIIGNTVLPFDDASIIRKYAGV